MDNRTIISGLRNKIAEIEKLIDWMEKSGQIHPIDFDLILSKTRELYTETLRFSGGDLLEAPAKSATERVKPPIPSTPTLTPAPFAAEPPTFFKPPIISEEPQVKNPIPAATEKPVVNDLPPVVQQEAPPEPARQASPQVSKISGSEPNINASHYHREDSINEMLGKQKPVQDLASAITETPVADIWSAIAINDRFLYTRELFGNDSESFKTTVSLLNSIASWEAARKYIAEHYSWEKNNPVAKDFLTVIRRRFL